MNRSKVKFNNPIRVMALVLTLVFAMLMVTPVSAAKKEEKLAINEISSVVLHKSKTDLVFEIVLTKEYVKEHKSSSVYLFELLPYHTQADINSIEPLKSFKVDEKSTVKVPYYIGNRSRLFSRFVVAQEKGDGTYNVITEEKYVDNISVLASNTSEYPTRSSKKGLNFSDLADAQRLGVTHTVINVAVNEYMLGEKNDNAQSFIYNGQTFYVDGKKLSILDHRVKTYTDAGMNVYFNIILTSPAESSHESLMSLFGDTSSTVASQYAINTESEAGMKMFQAFVDYLSAHYTRADRAYGFVPAMILGYEVNSNLTWSNAAVTDIDSRVESYARAFRVLYTAMASHYSEGRVYISLGNNFCAAKNGPNGEVGPDYGYAAKDFLDLFAAKIKLGGDIPWGLSINPYPSDSSLTEYWNDGSAEDSYQTSYVTMKNIGTLTAYMNEEPMLYGEEARSIIIGEFGVSGNPLNENEMTMQAAAYALAYYTADQNEDIDAFIYHRHVDHAEESGCYGLWSRIDGSVNDPMSKKPIYNVFSQIDTENSEAVTEFVEQAVGNKAFGTYMAEKIKYKQFNTRTVFPSVDAHSTDFDRGYKTKVLFDLTGGNLQNFYPSDNAQYVELRPVEDGTKTALYAKVSDTPIDYNGISNNAFAPKALKHGHYITLRVMVEAPAGTGKVNFMLRLQNDGDGENDTFVYEGEASVQANEWTDVSFKIKDFTKKTGGNVDSMKVWISTQDPAAPSGEYGIWIENVTLHTRGGLGIIGWIFIIILIIFALLVAAYGVLYIRAQRIRKKRRAMAERRRREMMQRQQMMNTQNMYPPQYNQQMPPNYRNNQNR